MVKVGDKGQIVIPAKAREIIQIETGDKLIVLGDEKNKGFAIIKEILSCYAKKFQKGV